MKANTVVQNLSSKAQPRSKRQNKNWTNLTDPKKLRHIAKLIDGALNEAPSDGSMSLADFKEFAEAYSEEHTKHPIAMELCEGTDGEIRGFRFYLASNPKERTSGKYLALNLQKAGVEVEENKYTPSNVVSQLGLDSDLDDLDLEDEVDLEEDLDLEDDLKDLDWENFEINVGDLDKLLEEEELRPSDVAPQSSIKASKQQVDKRQSEKRQASKSAPTSRSTGDRSASSRSDPLEDISDAGGRAAVSGSDLNGINAAGLTAQLATLGVVLSAKARDKLQQLIEDLRKQGEEARLSQILETLQRQNERVGDLAERLHELRSPLPSSEADITQDSAAEAIASATSRLGGKVNKLERELDSNHKPLSPLKLNNEEDLSVRLERIEDYLNQMVKHIDRLEQRIEKLEEARLYSADVSKLANPGEQPLAASAIPSEPAITAKQPNAAKSQQTAQHQTEYAEALVKFAAAAHHVTAKQPVDGIAAFQDRTVFVEHVDNEKFVSLEDKADRALFSATKAGQNWTIYEDQLSEKDADTILRLPQTPEAYQTRETAEAFVSALQKRLPHIFEEKSEPSFALSEQGVVTYEFEMSRSAKGKKYLLGFDARNNGKQIFVAELSKASHPDIQQCDIPLEVMQALVSDRQDSRTQPSQSADQYEKQPASQSKQDKREEMQA
jgi:hypothetical protein